MKKFLSFIFVFILTFGSAFCEVTAPSWQDVSPAVHSKISTTASYKLPIKQYWQTRRIKFEESVTSCEKHFAGASLNRCYQQLVQLEKSKNEMREQQLVERSRADLFRVIK